MDIVPMLNEEAEQILTEMYSCYVPIEDQCVN